MGYDMHMVRTPDGEEERFGAARREFDEAVAARDALYLPPGDPEYKAAQEKVSAAYDAMYEAHTSYFRLSIWSMRECRAIMHHFGMLLETTTPLRRRPWRRTASAPTSTTTPSGPRGSCRSR
ncbi:hypothetical protein SVIO_000020 [Streptomyces violaceusniger]|uniref:Uncharacterized protein n=1 Tax=Streptomyces violaceusniger TaxID=68280 RepID=A0A4D4KU41_STRVO|nr:hypothetical protein SVIO_000020 [Streptomyces violaceusniger]